MYEPLNAMNFENRPYCKSLHVHVMNDYFSKAVFVHMYTPACKVFKMCEGQVAGYNLR